MVRWTQVLVMAIWGRCFRCIRHNLTHRQLFEERFFTWTLGSRPYLTHVVCGVLQYCNKVLCCCLIQVSSLLTGIQRHSQLINSFLLVCFGDAMEMPWKGIMDPSEVNSRSYFIVSSHTWTGSCRGTCAVNGGSGEPLAIVTVFIRCSTSSSIRYSSCIPIFSWCTPCLHLLCVCEISRKCRWGMCNGDYTRDYIPVLHRIQSVGIGASLLASQILMAVNRQALVLSL